MKRIGFWSEQGWSHRSLGEDLIDQAEERIEVENEILEFLKIGIPVLAIRTMTCSKVTGKMFGPVTAYSDGVWAWTNILIYYYSHGLLILPEEFKQHARTTNKVFLRLGLMAEEKKHQIAVAVGNPDSPIIILK